MSTCNSGSNACTEAPESGRFALPSGTGPVSLTAEYGLMRVSGADAVDFLHRQFTNAVKDLGDRVENAGWCSPKGRMLAAFRLWQDGDAVMILVPKAIGPAFFKRLRMYVLRDKVEFACTAPGRHIYGIAWDAAETLRAAGLPVPEAGRAVIKDGVTVLSVQPAAAAEGFVSGGERAIVIAPAEKELFADARGSGLWWASEIAAGCASVWPATRELFVPQAVNYELIGGVSFTKGCYPGQEVVSRVQNIGTPSRRAAAGIAAGAAPAAGDPVFAQGSECGTVIEAVEAEGRALVFYSALCDALKAGGIALDKEGRRVLAPVAFPYDVKL
jgi:folate-binding protein YgfZ